MAGHVAHAHVETSQSSKEDVATWARLLNHPHIERQIMAADEIAELINREPCPDEALLCGILLCSNDALEGLTRIILTADDESRQTACNLLFMLSMSEPDRPFAGTLCSAHKANRAIIGASPGLFSAFVAGHIDPVYSFDALRQCACMHARVNARTFLFLFGIVGFFDVFLRTFLLFISDVHDQTSYQN